MAERLPPNPFVKFLSNNSPLVEAPGPSTRHHLALKNESLERERQSERLTSIFFHFAKLLLILDYMSKHVLCRPLPPWPYRRPCRCRWHLCSQKLPHVALNRGTPDLEAKRGADIKKRGKSFGHEYTEGHGFVDNSGRDWRVALVFSFSLNFHSWILVFTVNRTLFTLICRGT